jgi:hypothetical protein
LPSTKQSRGENSRRPQGGWSRQLLIFWLCRIYFPSSGVNRFMRNKWYVAGILVPAAALAYGAVHAALGGNGLPFILPPAVLAVALIGAAVWVARTETFAPAAKARWDYGTSAAVARWTKHRNEMDAAKRATSASTPPPPKL